MIMNRNIPVICRIRFFMLLIVLPCVLFLSSCERVDIFEESGGGTSSGQSLEVSFGGVSMVSDGTADFGTGVVNYSSSVDLILVNSGDEMMTISVVIQGTDSAYFTCTTPPSSLDVSATANMTIIFNPTDTTTRTAELVISTTDSTFTLVLTGTAAL